MDAYLSAGRPTRPHIAFALVAPPDVDVLPYPEAVVEPAAERYPVLVDHAWESGFGLALGDPAGDDRRGVRARRMVHPPADGRRTACLDDGRADVAARFVAGGPPARTGR
ncbi:hypothetical protein ACU686_13900 [Yinghuangia aomiensis]